MLNIYNCYKTQAQSMVTPESFILKIFLHSLVLEKFRQIQTQVSIYLSIPSVCLQLSDFIRLPKYAVIVFSLLLRKFCSTSTFPPGPAREAICEQMDMITSNDGYVGYNKNTSHCQTLSNVNINSREKVRTGTSHILK